MKSKSSVTCRAGMYVAVLLTGTTVFVVGVAGLLAMRLQTETAGDTRDTTAAQFLAHAGIELALLQLDTDPYSYLAPADPGWQSASPLERGSCTWRLLDEATGDVASTVDGLLRLQGKGMIGNATRIVGVQLMTRDKALAANAVPQGDMETVATWETFSLCNYAYDDSYQGRPPPEGDAFLTVKQRTARYATALADITSKLTTSGKTWEAQAWMLTESANEQACFVFTIRASGSGTQVARAIAETVIEDQWTRVSATQTLTWSGTLEAAYFGVAPNSTIQDFAIDCLILAPQESVGVDIRVVPGSWRRDVE